ncbi:hypothetical protein T492DRAFT_875089 [Pavlovales sp. CCMP2436]|nr:hypothetical protein T492DRAFT_875089 [Pavlovales sp. CCMP2436]
MSSRCAGDDIGCLCPLHGHKMLALRDSLARCRRALLSQTANAEYYRVGQPTPDAAAAADGAAASPPPPPKGRAEPEAEADVAVVDSPRAHQTPPSLVAPRTQPASTPRLATASGVGADAVAAASPPVGPAEAALAAGAAADEATEAGASPQGGAMVGASPASSLPSPAPRILEPASTPSPALALALASQSQDPWESSLMVLAAASPMAASPIAASPLAASPLASVDEQEQLRPPSALPRASDPPPRAPGTALLAPTARSAAGCPAALPLPLPTSLRAGAAGSDHLAAEPGGGASPGGGAEPLLPCTRLDAAPPHQPLAAGEWPLSVSSCVAGCVLLTYRRWADLWWCTAGKEGAQQQPRWQLLGRLGPREEGLLLASSLHRRHEGSASIALLSSSPHAHAAGGAGAALTLYALAPPPAGPAKRAARPVERTRAEPLQLGARCALAVHALSDTRAVFALAGGLAALWTAGAPLAERLRLLPAPPWAAQPGADGGEALGGLQGAEDGGGALTLLVPSWSDSLLIGTCARGLCVWSLDRCTLLLGFGAAPPATSPPVRATLAECAVVLAHYQPTSACEAEMLRDLLPAATAHHQRGGEPQAARALALLLLAPRPRQAGAAGFWRCLDNGEREPDPLGVPRPPASAAGAPSDAGVGDAVHLLAVTGAALVTLRRFARPESMRAAAGGQPRAGWAQASTSAHWVAALCEASGAACVWAVGSGECVATVRLPASGVHVCVQDAVGAGEVRWALWQLQHPSSSASASAALSVFEAASDARPARGKRACAAVEATAAGAKRPSPPASSSAARAPLHPLTVRDAPQTLPHGRPAGPQPKWELGAPPALRPSCVPPSFGNASFGNALLGPAQGGFAPLGGGFTPQGGGGFAPQVGGFAPQGGGFAPQGGGFAPQGGGGGGFKSAGGSERALSAAALERARMLFDGLDDDDAYADTHSLVKEIAAQGGRKMYALMGVSPMEAAARIKKQLIDTIGTIAARGHAQLLLARLSALAPIAAQRGNTTNSNQQIISLNALARAHYRRSIGTRGGAQASAAD